jgi:hypothetical protein
MMVAAVDPSNDHSASAPAERQRTLWLICSTAASLAAAAPILQQMRERFPRLRVICTPRDRDQAASLRAGDPGTIVADPLPSLWRAASVLRRHNARLVLLLDGVAPGEAALLRAARRRQIPVVLLASSGVGLDERRAGLLDLVERFIATDAAALSALAAAGIDSQRVVSVVDAAETATAADALSGLLRRDLKALRSERRVLRRAIERLAVAAVDHPAARRLTGRGAERIATLDDLAARLGRPRTIMCLGNGPSSEDPRLPALGYDALFRVNHLWQERGVLTDPTVVFTGSAETVRRVRGALIAISLIRHEGRLVLAGLTRRGGRPFRFVTAERLGILVPRRDWGEAIPTNGAYMLATAVALCPARLVVAGIDLFRHQGGAYPGDPTTPNAYTPRHAAELDERVILSTLATYRGELVIISDVLRALWEAAAKPSA